MVTAFRVPEGVDGKAIPEAHEDALRGRDRGRPGQAVRPDRPHRPLRVLRLPRRPDAVGALEHVLRELGRPVEPGAGVAAAQRVFAETRAGDGVAMAAAPAGTLARADLRVLVCEKIADAGVAHLSSLFSVDLGLDWTKERAADRIARLRRDRGAQRDQGHGRADRPRRPPEGGGPRRHRRRQRGRPGGHPPGHRGLQRRRAPTPCRPPSTPSPCWCPRRATSRRPTPAWCRGAGSAPSSAASR